MPSRHSAGGTTLMPASSSVVNATPAPSAVVPSQVPIPATRPASDEARPTARDARPPSQDARDTGATARLREATLGFLCRPGRSRLTCRDERDQNGDDEEGDAEERARPGARGPQSGEDLLDRRSRDGRAGLLGDQPQHHTRDRHGTQPGDCVGRASRMLSANCPESRRRRAGAWIRSGSVLPPRVTGARKCTATQAVTTVKPTIGKKATGRGT